ncbi:hypothetical protein [Haloechinothrix sp. LS1_15]|uniref:hypothetical protein n=1 Tax=Haloechinothrix sp. LS1_15 TaxID=2652248 RepID=UPI002948A9F0|nr:hypothetical protein [Haloechinothrix sp. LS1_15]MDV6014676.1 hypothetical protein [Haloechinothrix sp. LS1_15]
MVALPTYGWMPQIPEDIRRLPAHWVAPGTPKERLPQGRGYPSACGQAYCLPIYGWDRLSRIYAHQACADCAALAPYPPRTPLRHEPGSLP